MHTVHTMTPCLACGEPIPTGWPCPCGTPERAGVVEARRPGVDGHRRRRVDRKRDRSSARYVIQAARRAHADLERGAA